MNRVSSIDIYTVPWVKQIADEKLLYNIGSPASHSVNDIEGWDGGGKWAQKRGDMYIHIQL